MYVLIGCLNLSVQVSLKFFSNIFFTPLSAANSTLISLHFTFYNTSAFLCSASELLESILSSYELFHCNMTSYVFVTLWDKDHVTTYSLNTWSEPKLYFSGAKSKVSCICITCCYWSLLTIISSAQFTCIDDLVLYSINNRVQLSREKSTSFGSINYSLYFTNIILNSY